MPKIPIKEQHLQLPDEESPLSKSEAKQMFKRLDENESGTIEHKEIRYVLGVKGVKPTENEVNDVIHFFDKDGDGQICENEFVHFMTSKYAKRGDSIMKIFQVMYPSWSESEARKLFQKVDCDKNDLIDANDIYLTMRNHGVKVTNKDIDDTIKIISVTNDNKISQSEFIHFMTSASRSSSHDRLAPTSYQSKDTDAFMEESRSIIKLFKVLRPKLSKQEAKRIFQKLDCDSDGIITKSDVRKQMKKEGIKVTKKEIDDILAFLKDKCHGKVRKNQFVAFMISQDASKVESLHKFFTGIRHIWNDTQYLQEEDFPMSQKDAEHLFDIFDIDKSKRIEKDEIKHVMRIRGVSDDDIDIDNDTMIDEIVRVFGREIKGKTKEYFIRKKDFVNMMISNETLVGESFMKFFKGIPFHNQSKTSAKHSFRHISLKEFPLSQSDANALFQKLKKVEHDEIHTKATQTQIREIFRIFSIHGETKISKRNFVHVMTSENSLAGESILNFFNDLLSSWSDEEIKLIFEALDTNKNGSLTKSEIRHELKSHQVDVSDDEIDEIIRFLDASGDGEISKEEFTYFLTLPNKQQSIRQNINQDNSIRSIKSQNIIQVDSIRSIQKTKTLLKEASMQSDAMSIWSDTEAQQIFDQLDVNKNGSLSKAEIRHELKNFGVQITDDDIDEIIHVLDVSGDGEICKEEFQSFMKYHS